MISASKASPLITVIAPSFVTYVSSLLKLTPRILPSMLRNPGVIREKLPKTRSLSPTISE